MGLAGEQTTPIQNGRGETRQKHWYEDVMRLHKAAPKLIVQERVGERMKISSYCLVASLTRAGLALGQLHHASHQNGRPCPWRALRSRRIRSFLIPFSSPPPPLSPHPHFRPLPS